MKRSIKGCPCGGESYRSCCQPYHRGAEPEDPARLVRSRFSAFVLGEGDYLWRTLHEAHELRAREREHVVRELSRARQRLRYRALTIHEVRVDGDEAQVTFTVRVFERGKDRSFSERSSFARTSEGWRYQSGVVLEEPRV